MWYVKCNGTIIPQPYQRYSDCLAACKELQRKMVGVFTDPVYIE